MKKILLLFFIILFSCEKDPIKYNLSVRSNPIDGGLVNPASGSYEAGERVTILSQANQFFSFKNWSGDWSSSNDQIIITMDSDKNIIANFEKLDTDGDGITDDIDLCANTDASAAIIGPNGCEVSLFYLADNGITIKAIDEAQVGMQQVFDGNLYTVVSENQLRQMVETNQNVGTVVTSKITNLSRLFQFKGLVGDIRSWDVSNVTNMSYMFAGYPGFNQDISNWDVSNVTNMKGMFYSIPVDLSQINSDSEIPLYIPYGAVASAVFAGMFNQSPSLAPILQPLISSYAGPNSSSGFIELGNAVATDLNPYIVNQYTIATTEAYQNAAAQFGLPYSTLASGGLADQGIPDIETAINNGVDIVISEIISRFNLAENTYRGSFNKDIGGWDVSNVTDMSYMFYHSKFNQNISNWNVSNVTTMKYMFGRASNFNQNLNSWSVSNVTECFRFNVGSASWISSKPNFTNCNPD